MEKKNYCKIKMQKRDNKLVPMGYANEVVLNDLIKNMDDKQFAWVLIETNESDGSYLQLSRIHATIRECALASGVSFGEFKAMVKARTGLTDKSFGDCSKEELSNVIFYLEQVCNELGIPIV